MWNDNDTAVDLLDYQYLVESINSIICNDDLIPCTIGIFGDWGCGKSSLMRMVENSFEGQEGILLIKFNGWLFEGYEDARSVLMAAILEEVGGNLRTGEEIKEKAKNLFGKLIKRINWMKVLSSSAKLGFAIGTGDPNLLGMGAMDLVGKVVNENPEDYLKKKEEQSDSNIRMGIRDFHKDFEELLSLTNIKRLVVCIDDLDRCRPETIIETLEAIKLFLYSKSSAFVLAADERIIKLAVKDRFKGIGVDPSIETDYLEKLIQFPIRIPQLNATEIETYINLLFTKLALRDKVSEFEDIRKKVIQKRRTDFFSVPFDLDFAKQLISENFPEELNDSLVLSRQITPILADGLKGNPRQCKRFLNTLLLRVVMADSLGITLSKRIMAKLMLLEYFKPDSFRKLFEIQSAQSGKPKEISKLEFTVLGSAEVGSEDADPLSEPFQSWLADEKIIQWLKMEPLIANVDLRPYFYFSRDEIVGLGTVKSKLSRLGKELLTDLLGESVTKLRSALKKCCDLSGIDASIIYKTLKEKYEVAELPKDKKGYFKKLSEFVEERQELMAELIQFLNTIPLKLVYAEFVEKVWSMTIGSQFEPSAKVLLEKWKLSESENPSLAKIATSILNPK